MGLIVKSRKRGTFWKRLRFKYKLSFFDETTLEEVWSLHISRLSVLTMALVFAFFLVAITSLVIIKTPIRNYLPGYLDIEVRNDIMRNALRVDSLERILEAQAQYLENVSDILMGTVRVDSVQPTDSMAFITANYDIPRSEIEEQFVRTFEEEEKYNLTALGGTVPSKTDGVLFYKPANGVVSASYDAKIRHYGIDLTAGLRASVLATLDGVVIYAGFDPQSGNVIGLQHRNGFVSIYKHNEVLLKEEGDQVVAGEAIALIGNTGHLSTGPHLHFELWSRGMPVDPTEYIAF